MLANKRRQCKSRFINVLPVFPTLLAEF